MTKLARTTRFALWLALALGFTRCAPSPAPSPTQGKHYVCSPCQSPCDGTVYDHPGTCPVCGMPLVEHGSPAAQGPAGKPVAILVFDGVEIIDFTGPWEVFGAAGFDVYTVAATREPVTTAMKMKVVPRYTFADAPRPAVLLVPGGAVNGARSSAATLKWVTETSAQAEQTMSVCNGAFILAGAGLLDGLTATTTAHLIPKLAEEFPATHVVSDRRFVDNGRIITTAGLSSGIDGALHLVEKMRGLGQAQAAALGIEYDWHRDGRFVRAALADHLIPDANLDAVGRWAFDKTEGTTDQWDMILRGTSPKSAEELLDYIGQAFTKGKWRRGASTATSSSFRFEDGGGKPWTGTLAIDPPRGDQREYFLHLHIARERG
jgi:transcriptional regulator GlxA family with amidase domain